MLALLYPGQGAQSEGFLHRLPLHHAVQDTLAEAADTLGIDVLRLDSPGALDSTVAVQLGLTIAGVAIARALADEGLAAQISAGLSVGAFAAAVDCGAVAFRDALQLVRRRAELMETAYPSGYGLAAVSGLSEQQVETLVARQAAQQRQRVYIGNVNAPRQIVVAGADDALDAFIEHALAAGARKATRLAVSVPSHCELLAHASDELLAYSRELPFERPRGIYIGNRGGRPLYTAEAIREDLATNMRYTVRWFDALTAMQEMGAHVLVEAPPGQVSTDIVREYFPEAIALAASTLPFDRLAGTVRRRLAG
ncbi:malonate decarboxylase subunit epsilon [Paraburkholderia sp. MMS20-SJTN17]|uniref:[acyl-carrier-protein] S-malonyltransferase n=1 Tax=Paraburkholderia translucens TaxID=2886945 RepID=A0ABS8KIV8_9BURK|nr:malonate decarboxylase subunit epsilon [Paraburkholderia sp. MMS20-SJTN17]MCC8404352.1 malonate decarboxylase subunit epsilon [Paraburkholderia sp. MMS20-SJTN17]